MISGYHLLGAPIAKTIESRVESVGRRLAPWLWIFTLAGFGLSVWSVFGQNRLEHRA